MWFCTIRIAKSVPMFCWYNSFVLDNLLLKERRGCMKTKIVDKNCLLDIKQSLENGDIVAFPTTKGNAFSFGLFLAFSAGLFVVNSTGPQQAVKTNLIYWLIY